MLPILTPLSLLLSWCSDALAHRMGKALQNLLVWLQGGAGFSYATRRGPILRTSSAPCCLVVFRVLTSGSSWKSFFWKKLWKALNQGVNPDKGAKAPTLESCPGWRQDLAATPIETSATRQGRERGKNHPAAHFFCSFELISILADYQFKQCFFLF